MKRLLLPIVLVLVGVYFLFVHSDPLPLNHDSLGLHNHLIHSVIGVALLLGGGFMYLRSRKA